MFPVHDLLCLKTRWWSVGTTVRTILGLRNEAMRLFCDVLTVKFKVVPKFDLCVSFFFFYIINCFDLVVI